jgi:hypothetical protein
MKQRQQIDFVSIKWNLIKDNLDFFYQEALSYNNKIIEDLNGLNNKGFALLAVALPVLSAAAGFLLAVWGKAGSEAIVAALLCACGCMFAVLVLLFLAVFPRGIWRGEGSPFVYFSSGYYERNMPSIIAGNIKTLDKYIRHNQGVMAYRGRLITAAIPLFILTPVITLGVFLFFLP